MSTQSPEEIFDREMKPLGGRLDPDIFNPNVARIFENHRQRAEKWIFDVKSNYLPAMPVVHFDFINNPELNAIAFAADGHEFIGIYAGTIIIILGLFRRMLADSTILMDVGNVHMETEKPPLNANWEPDANQLSLLEADISSPKDAVRRAHAHLLAELAIDFLISHEHAHLSNGHIALIQKITGSPFMTELGWDKSKNPSNITFQTLEMDADCDAVAQGLAKVFGRIRDVVNVREDWQSFYQKPEDALHTWLFSIFSLFRLFGSGHYDVDKLDSDNHPPAPMRQLMIFATVHEILGKQGYSELQDNLREIIPTVIREVETAFSQITGYKVDVDGLRDATSTQAQAHVTHILAHWKIIRPELLPLSRSNLAP